VPFVSNDAAAYGTSLRGSSLYLVLSLSFEPLLENAYGANHH
jgi:hypothetical protein